MKRVLTRGLFTSVAATALLLGLVATPAGAAKGTIKIASVKGTISGTQTITVTCGWGTFDFGGGPQFQQFGETDITFSDVLVNASTLGGGTMTMHIFMGPGGGDQSWTFKATQAKNSLTGQANANFDFNGQFPSENLYLNVNSGTGKFAGVSGGSLQTLGFAVDQPFCDPGDGSSGDVTFGPITGTPTTFSVPIYGQLLF